MFVCILLYFSIELSISVIEFDIVIIIGEHQLLMPSYFTHYFLLLELRHLCVWPAYP